MISIIRDTKEQKGYDFWGFDVQVISHKLKEGDYSLADCADIIIERKANTGELYMNLGCKKEKERFYKELTRLQTHKKPILLCEFPESHLYEFPINSGIPKDKHSSLRMSSSFLRKLVYEIPENFPPIKIVFMENREEAQRYIYNTFMESKNGPKKKFDF